MASLTWTFLFFADNLGTNLLDHLRLDIPALWGRAYLIMRYRWPYAVTLEFIKPGTTMNVTPEERRLMTRKTQYQKARRKQV
jgi:hypothetical protein